MKKINFLISGFLLICLGCSKVEIVKLPITTSSQEALEYYTEAEKLLGLNIGEGPEIRALLDSAIKLDPNFAMALEMYPTSDQLLAREYEEKAKQLSSKITEAERKTLSIRESYRSGNMDAALEGAVWLVENHENSYESYLMLGLVQSDRRELDEAISSLNKALELNPDSYKANYLLMGHHIGLGGQSMLPEENRDVTLGIEYGDELIRIRPEEGLSYHFKANCYRQLGEFEKAKDLYEKSIEKRKGRTSEGTAYNVSAHNYMFAGEMETARNRYEKSIELATTDWSWFLRSYYLTVSYIFENDYMGAIDNINKVEKNLINREVDNLITLQMNSYLSLHKLICYAHNQMEEEAYEALKNKTSFDREYANLLNDKNVTRTTESTEFQETAWVNILFGKYDMAKKDLENLREMQEKLNNPTAMYAYYGLSGMVNLMEGNIEQAMSDFELGDVTDVYYNYFRGLALKAGGQEAEASKVFTEIAKFNFSSWDIAIVRSLAKKQLGQT